VLEPSERVSEVLFGLIMVLTFTGSLSVAEAGRDDVRTMLIGALGCNLAWGIIDGILYLMGCLAERGRNLATYSAVREARDPQRANRAIADALPAVISAVLTPAEIDSVRERLREVSVPSPRPRLSRADWRGAAGVFLLVFLSTLPVAVPFMVMRNTHAAMRTSNAIAVAMLFCTGAAYGRSIGRSPWGAGLFVVFLGSLLVALTIVLGG
jgi:VIT1/CCC1 family predicted Fe2+/Mn2+ transporter